MDVCITQFHGCVWNATSRMCVEYHMMQVCTLHLDGRVYNTNFMDVCVTQLDGWMCNPNPMHVCTIQLDGCVYITI